MYAGLSKDTWTCVLRYCDVLAISRLSSTCSNLRTLLYEKELSKWRHLTINKNIERGLKVAAKEGKQNFVDFFISKGACMWNEATQYAAKGGHRHLVTLFMSKAAGGGDWQYVLMGASRGGHRQLVDEAILNGAENFSVGFAYAARGGHRDMVDFFISKGVNDEWGWGLHGAIRGGHRDLVDMFISTITSPQVNRCIAEAARCKNSTVRRDLVDFFISKAENDDIIIYWNLLLESAARGGHRDLVDFFIEKCFKDGIVINWEWGLYGAAQCTDSIVRRDLVDFFISKGANDWDLGKVAVTYGKNRDEQLIKFFLAMKEKEQNSTYFICKEFVSRNLHYVPILVLAGVFSFVWYVK